jgi:hypothetical protein
MSDETINTGQAEENISPTIANGPPPRPRAKASTLGYWLAAVIMLASLIGGGVLVVFTGFDTYDRLTDMPRAAVPGDVTFDVTKAGDQLVYYIGDADTSWRELGLTVTGPDGRDVQVKNCLFATDCARIAAYDRSDERVTHPDFAVATFRADQTGGYEIATSAGAEKGAEIAVGENMVGSVILRLSGALVIVLAGIATGVTLIIVTAVRRSARRAA